ncbi:uncharacterized protein FIBRA_01187 [Fibroporia radiculosa]|uniref:3-isopropylmalate dehydratase n=1 Tax=Fibroporia radiculosa TaxID=599839 RepID=J4HSW8_9APHY|nr:uncharacterized protein FIBRA_01187 [Fibroporia radiculosa]CCL99172.1 predicted protein [Fibroporia radiculosa]
MPAPVQQPRTLYDKIWDDHVVDVQDDGLALIYIDRHLVHEVTSPQAFEGLRNAGRGVRRPDCTLATVDHNIPTVSRKNFTSVDSFIEQPDSRAQCQALEENVKEFGLTYFGMTDRRQGIVHVIGPEQGFTLPGITCVCGDSHTSTHGAFGSLAFGIGTSEVEHVLATQTLLQKKGKNMRISVEGTLLEGVTSKDVILHIIGVIGTAGGTGCVVEYAGSVIRGFSMEARMSMCNMSIEGGARAGMIAPDEVTFNYLRGRPLTPKGEAWDRAEAYWRTLHSDEGAKFDIEVNIRAEDILPTVTWGTSPQDVVAITGAVPDPAKFADQKKREAVERSLKYMGLTPNTPMQDIKIDKVFIGSCTNSRIEDLRSAARVVLAAGPEAKVAEGVVAMVVPGSGLVKQHAEAEGLDAVFKRAGFDWREAGCSMCLGMNPDKLEPEERCASTSNRNFEGRQGPRGRTHLVSPAMAAAAAMTGKLTDVRKYLVAGTESGPKLKLANALEFLTDAVLASPEPEAPAKTAQSTSDKPLPAAEAPSSVAPLKIVKGIVTPLHIENVDTDMIIPSKFLKTLKRTGLANALFYPLRWHPQTGEKTDFILNREPYTRSKILVCDGPNFGCGSSREHAPWALKDFGILVVIAPSFGDIFRNNCMQNGMLPIVLSEAECRALAEDAEARQELEVDLEKQEIRRAGGKPTVAFTVDPFRRHCLLNGLDDIALTLQKVGGIEEFEKRRSENWPWLDGFGYKGTKIPVAIERKVKQMEWHVPLPVSSPALLSHRLRLFSSAHHLRPKVVRRDTDNILSYYQSEHAGRAYLASDAGSPPSIMRTASSTSNSSEYSSESPDAIAESRPYAPATDSGVAGHTRRPSVPSEGGADRRRVAIVELDSALPQSLTRKGSENKRPPTIESGSASLGSTILARRGLHVEGLALVAPPDASPRTYTNLTPPSTAPLTDRTVPNVQAQSAAHQRSMSEAVVAADSAKPRHQHKSSRDVGIVGVTRVPSVSKRGGREEGTTLNVPTFQSAIDPRSPSASRTPGAAQASYATQPQTAASTTLRSPNPDGRDHKVVTPAIGESKDISQPVVGPVVVGISSNLMRRDTPRDASHIATSSVSSPGDVFASRQAPYDHHSRSSRTETPFRYYDPELHATAGPLPPPPAFDPIVRVTSATPAPPRPPRAFGHVPPAGPRQDIHALRDALQLPKSVSAALASMPPPMSPKRSVPTLSRDSSRTREEIHDDAGPSRSLSKKSMHVREGAHPPSAVIGSPTLASDESVMLRGRDKDSRTPVSADDGSASLARSASPNEESTSSETGGVSSPPTDHSHSLHAVRSAIDLRRENSWVSLRQEEVSREVAPDRASYLSASKSPASSVSALSPTPPPKSIRGSPTNEQPLPSVHPYASGSGSGSGSNTSTNPFRGALTNLKRFSALPRTPSFTSSAAKNPSPPSTRHSRTPSPQIVVPPPRRPRPPREISSWPDAMEFKDIVARKNPLARSIGYAERINELVTYDCGLADWVQMQRRQATSRARSSAVKLTVTPATPSGKPHAPQPRHASRGSNASEQTFPTRPDAYSATDLSTRPIDVIPNTPPPSLPYPSLAQARSPARSSTLLMTSSRSLLPLSGNKNSGGGFFSSIGRKTSTKKDRSPVSPSRVLSKRNATTSTTTRPAVLQAATAPTVPGGPRAVPGRIQRAQTFSASASPSPKEPSPPPPAPSAPPPGRQSAAGRRPSLFARARGQGAPPQVQPQARTSHTARPPGPPDPDFERQVDKLADLLPHAERGVLAGYLRRAGQDILAIGQYLDDEKNGAVRRY